MNQYLLGRDAASLTLYAAHIAKLKAEYASVEDYVKHTKLGMQVQARPSDGKRVCIEKDDGKQQRILFTENDFPYTVEVSCARVLHMVSRDR